MNTCITELIFSHALGVANIDFGIFTFVC
jgi:hypothetical protein